MSGKSKEEIAFELVSKLKGLGVWGENNIDSILDALSLNAHSQPYIRSGASMPRICRPFSS